ncbi:MAG: zinc-binding dehydrogenase [Actinomycetota bacterium]|nr:zinc-binding dehydrogenase [Actinomycetota bacterium]
MHAVRRSGAGPGDVVVVQGAGPIGLSVLQVAKANGVDEVLVVEPNEDRRALARELGADLVATPEAAAEVVLDHTRGSGADVVIECAGLVDTVQSGIEFCRSGGTMCLVGIADGPVPIIPRELIAREVTLVSALAYLHEEFRMAMELIADGHVRLQQLHSSTVGLGDLPTVIERLAGGSAETKVLVDPSL